MAFQHGKNAYFAIDRDPDGAPALTDISAYVTDVSMPRNLDMAETSTFGNTYKTFVQGLASLTISISGRWDPTATTGPDAVLSSLIGAQATATFKYGPMGQGQVGDVYFGGEVYMASYEITSPVTDMVSFSASFQLATPSFTRTVQAA